MKSKAEIVANWLPRYTGTPASDFGSHILLVPFFDYVERFAKRFKAPIRGIGFPMQTCTNDAKLTIVNFGMGSPNAAIIMDLLTTINPKGVLFLGKCGGTKKATEIGHYVLPTAAIRGEGTSDDYAPPEVPALPSFKLHKFVSQKIVEANTEYRTGVVYTTNRRVWEHDNEFRDKLHRLRVLAIDMETATIFTVGLVNNIARGALLLVSDLPMTPEGVKTEAKDKEVSDRYVEEHLDIGIKAMTELETKGEQIKHFSF